MKGSLISRTSLRISINLKLIRVNEIQMTSNQKMIYYGSIFTKWASSMLGNGVNQSNKWKLINPRRECWILFKLSRFQIKLLKLKINPTKWKKVVSKRSKEIMEGRDFESDHLLKYWQPPCSVLLLLYWHIAK